MALLAINRHDEQPLVEQIVQGFSQRIEQRSMRSGSKVPSIRRFAEEHGVSRFTVVQAYDRLVASGHLQSRKGSGFYVGKLAATENVQTACRLDRAGDILWSLRQALKDGQHRLQPGCGWLPATWMESTNVQRSLRQLSRQNGGHLVEYSQAGGYVPLRQQLSRRMEEAGIRAEVPQIITCHGASHGVDLVCRLMLRPGDKVLIDDPAYFNLFGMLKLFGAEALPVPRNEDGPDIAALKALLQEHQPKLMMTTAILHNPTSSCISPGVAFELLKLAEQHDFYLLEDDIYGDLHPNPGPRLASLDQLNRVIYVSSFSKTISAALRVGYIACRQDLANELMDLKLLTQLTCSEITERTVHATLVDGFYRKHLSRLHSRLEEAREQASNGLEQLGFKIFGQAEHGIFLWTEVPEGSLNSIELAQKAMENDMVLAPGNVFRAEGQGANTMRFNVANTGQEALSLLAKILDAN
ncbi:MAG: PLP-dependent aminotransferase family protein [Cellvibrionaceae bacterium]|nr:PLP-dependent aminotransferase family protein [Cellvibrionaceae bacterium]